MQWFPVLPANQQSPYDPGPYRDLGLAPLGGLQTAAAARRVAAGPSSRARPAGSGSLR